MNLTEVLVTSLILLELSPRLTGLILTIVHNPRINAAFV